MEENTILVVDDDKDIRDMINIYLINQAMKVYTAADGVEALKVLENTKVDLIVLDVMMPKMDGMEACMKIREKLNVPIIILSAKIDELYINISTHEVLLKNNYLKLTPYEFKILVLLAKNRGHVFSIASIYENVWKENYVSSDRTVTVHIRRIREKIGKEYDYIKTVWGVGYKIEN